MSLTCSCEASELHAIASQLPSQEVGILVSIAKQILAENKTGRERPGPQPNGESKDTLRMPPHA